MGYLFLALGLISSVLIFFFVTKNRYTKYDDEKGELKKSTSAELLDRIEQAENLTQVNKIRVDLKAADISTIGKEALFDLLKKKRLLILAEAEDFNLNEKGEYND